MNFKMKKCSLLTLIILVQLGLSAQTTKMLGITFGTTSALGKFGKNGDSTTSNAKGGLCYNLNYDYVSAKNWGGFISFSNQSFGLDADIYTDLNDPDFTRTSYSWTNYNIKTLNSGYSYYINKNSTVSFIPKIGIGFNIIRGMTIEADYLALGSNVNFKEEKDGAFLINYNLGLDIAYRKSPESRLGYYVKYQLNFSSGEISSKTSTRINGSLFDESSSKINKPYNFSSFSIGARYILKGKE